MTKRGAWLVLMLILAGTDGVRAGDLRPRKPPGARGGSGARPSASATPSSAGAPTAPTRARTPQSVKDAFKMHASGRLEFHARDLNVADALAQLRQLTRRNIIVAPNVRARFTGDLYDVTLVELLDAVCESTGLRVRVAGSFIHVEPTAVETRIFQLDYARAQDVVALLTPLLSAEGKLTATLASQRGIRSSQDEAGGDDYAAREMVVAIDHARNLASLEEAIQALDARPQQVLIEATICSADVTGDRALGVEFTSLAGVDFQSMSAVSPGAQGVTLGNVPPGALDTGAANGSTNLLDGLPTTGLNLGILKNKVGVFLRALKKVTDVTVLANPKVLALNKQRGEVIIGRRDGYLTTTVTQTSSIQNVEFLETGTRLLFRPFISSDGYVRLEIHPEDSAGGINADGLPFKETAEVTTNILVRSGDTVVIGGLFRERRSATRRKVPGLGDLPGAGVLFRSDQNESSKEEIIIMLTPRVMGTPKTTNAGARRSNERATSLGRTRLADSYVAAARRMLAAGRTSGAAGMLDAAEGVQPGRADVQALRARVVLPGVASPTSRRVDDRILERVAPDAVRPPAPAPDAARPAVGSVLDQRILESLAPRVAPRVAPRAAQPHRAVPRARVPAPAPPPPPPPRWPEPQGGGR